MNRDLMLAVLALNAYKPSQNVGLATSIDSDDKPSGFAATAYSYKGETVISYRGTDGGNDVLNGWAGGLGFDSTQAGLAIEFYRDIVSYDASSATSFPYSTAGSVTFTGHSLGGGLAGLMASLYGAQAVVFNNMAFRNAATNISANAVYDMNLMFNVYGSGNPLAPNSSGVSGYRMDWQGLNFQSEGEVVGADVSWGLGANAILDLHSQALLVLNIYADQEAGLDPIWKDVAPYLGQPLLDLPGDGITKIAYSVISEGTTPNGDAAAHSLFDDAADIANFINADVAASYFIDWTSSLPQIAVQFAHRQAVNDVEVTSMGYEGGGVFHATDSGLYLSLDSSVNAWGNVSTISGWDALKGDILDQLEAENGGSISQEASDIIDEVDYAFFSSGGTVDLTLDGANPMVVAGQISDVATAGGLVYGTDQADKITGGKGDDFIIGGGESDTLIGGDGIDALFGGEGADILVSGSPDVAFETSSSEPETIDGDADSDYLVLSSVLGGQVTVIGGDVADKILVHTKIFGDVGGEGVASDAKLFALQGGVFGYCHYGGSALIVSP